MQALRLSEGAMRIDRITHSKPVMNRRMTPTLRRVGNCSFETATIGRTNMYISIARPIAD